MKIRAQEVLDPLELLDKSVALLADAASCIENAKESSKVLESGYEYVIKLCQDLEVEIHRLIGDEEAGI